MSKNNLIYEFEERAAIHEYDGGLSKNEAERTSFTDTMNKQHFDEIPPEEFMELVEYFRTLLRWKSEKTTQVDVLEPR